MIKLLIRADASMAMGTGHIMRCLALAQTCHRMGGNAFIAMAQATPALMDRLEANGVQTYVLRSTAGTSEDAQETSRLGQQIAADWLAIDGYHFDAIYQQTIKAAGLPLLCLDDFGQAAFYAADIVLNQNIYAHESLYTDRAPYTRLLLGTGYALLRDEFWQWQGWQRQTAPVARHLLVTLGGADADNVTLKVIQALQLTETSLAEIRVIVGGSNPHYASLKQAVDASSLPIQLLNNVADMPELMAWADLAITAGGTTAWELAFMGLPSLMLILAENQRSIAKTLDSQGITVNLGWHQAVTEQQIAQAITLLSAQKQTRMAMTQLGQLLVDGKGAERVLVHLKNVAVSPVLKLRRVHHQDCHLIWQWANDPEVRAVSFSSEPIPWNTHVQWFAEKLQDPNCYFLIALNGSNQAIGQVRFQITDQDAEIHMSLAPEKRRLGYGSVLINAAVADLFQHTAVQVVQAWIKPDNLASIRVFERAQFQPCGVDTVKGQRALSYRRFRTDLS